ncbi:efflux RND transporter periplasmic adaptor subunit [Marivita hallyeonensis]|uniref:RND family efflux transporter, MFP subunit n=1 Tax=Marivita hallyeonensis TaxID=996342 RepID=A0A1M5S5F9_9RHOB|nr:efflux RND transporter periplasmic adaptor subunit [Marivita hallyeonensis]SHH33872.1 RND family efflux transporter, MFP subunit [Marivita hallyeonensis]
MSFDAAFILIILVSAAFGLRAGFAGSVIGAVAIAVVTVMALTGTEQIALITLSIWAIFLFGFAVIWPAKGASTASRAYGALLGLGQGIAAMFVISGTLLSTVYKDRPAAAEHLRQAALYQPTFMVAQATGLDQTALSFPAPLEVTVGAAPQVPPTIDWARAEPFTNAPVRTLPGEVRALDRTSLAFEVDGRVTTVTVDIGEHFAAGDVLAQLDTHLLNIALEERRAALIEAEARLSEARQEFQRQSTLFDRNVVSESVLETVAAALDAARSRYEIALRGIETAEDRLKDATLRAPYDGTVALRMVEPAQTVAAGAPVLEIQSNGGGFEVTATVPDTVVTRLELGSEHSIRTLDDTGATLSAVLQDIGSRAVSTAGFPVTLRVTEADTDLRSGLSVEIAFLLGRDDPADASLAVPVSAVLSDLDQGHAVYVVNPDTGALSRRAVTLAGTEGGVALVSDGLEDGDVVATRGLPFLEDGMTVHLRGTGVARYDQ